MLTQRQCDSVLATFEEYGAEEAGELCVTLLRHNDANESFRQALVDADSELSAIAHGRPPSTKDELVKIYSKVRSIYER